MLTKLIPSLKARLLAQRTSLMGQLVSLRGGEVGRAEASAEHFGHPEDSTAQTNTERELEFALDAHESAELRLVEEALNRIEAGTYGVCIDCGTDIPPERLQVAPEAARCIPCQEKVE